MNERRNGVARDGTSPSGQGQILLNKFESAKQSSTTYIQVARIQKCFLLAPVRSHASTIPATATPILYSLMYMCPYLCTQTTKTLSPFCFPGLVVAQRSMRCVNMFLNGMMEDLVNGSRFDQGSTKGWSNALILIIPLYWGLFIPRRPTWFHLIRAILRPSVRPPTRQDSTETF